MFLLNARPLLCDYKPSHPRNAGTERDSVSPARQEEGWAREKGAPIGVRVQGSWRKHPAWLGLVMIDKSEYGRGHRKIPYNTEYNSPSVMNFRADRLKKLEGRKPKETCRLENISRRFKRRTNNKTYGLENLSSRSFHGQIAPRLRPHPVAEKLGLKIVRGRGSLLVMPYAMFLAGCRRKCYRRR